MSNSRSPLPILVIHGPNLNMLGKREPEIYGKETLDEINRHLESAGSEMNMSVRSFQSNHEGELVTEIQNAMGNVRGVIINPGAYTHTSVAIRDALLLLDCPLIEVHLSNIYKREPFRHKSLVSDIATGQIAGLGSKGYELALIAIRSLLND